MGAGKPIIGGGAGTGLSAKCAKAGLIVLADRHLLALVRQMVLSRLQGHSVQEISAGLVCTERKVQRVLERVRKRLERLQVC